MIMFEERSIIDWLSYRSYEAQRINNPHIPYYKWRKIFNQAIEFEEIFDNHLKAIKNIQFTIKEL